MSKFQIGLDAGNYDTKTSHSSTATGFSSYTSLPFAANDCLFYNGEFYVPENRRFPYTKDKTINENLFILSLFGIAKEILVKATAINDKKIKEAATNSALKSKILGVQGEIDRITAIDLGIGLPPTHCSTLREPSIKYYEDRMKDGVQFEYNNYKYNLRLTKCKCYPQDMAALIVYKPKDLNSITNTLTSYYGIDIGGWTVDVVAIMKGTIQMSLCDSLPLGILAMFNTMVREIEIETGTRLTHENIESVLLRMPTILDEHIVELINAKAKAWFENILRELAQLGIEPATYPIIFLGGGAKLFEKYIKESTLIKRFEIIGDPHANAEAYRILLKSDK